MDFIIRSVAFVVYMILCFAILGVFLYFYFRPKKETEICEVRKSVLQLLISAALLIASILLIIIVNKSDLGGRDWYVYMEEGLFLFLAGMGIWGVLDFLNYRILFNEEKIVKRNAFGRKRVFYFDQMEGLSDHSNAITVIFRNGRIHLDNMCRGKEKFLFYMETYYANEHGGRRIPLIKSIDPEEFGVIVFVILFFLSYLMPASDITTDQFTGEIRELRQEKNMDEKVIFHMEGNYKTFYVSDGTNIIRDFSELKISAAQGKKFTVAVREKGDFDYKVYQIKDENGKKYLCYADSSKQEKKAYFLLAVGGGIVLTAVLLLVLLSYWKSEKFPNLCRFFFHI